MTSQPAKNKRAGAKAEQLVVDYLSKWWPLAERRRLTGAWDKGDVAGIADTVVEVKAEKKISLSGYMNELEVEIGNANARRGAAIVKKRGTLNVGDWYAVVPVKELVRLWLVDYRGYEHPPHYSEYSVDEGDDDTNLLDRQVGTESERKRKHGVDESDDNNGFVG